MPYTLKDLGAVFRNTMYDTICGGDGSLPPSKDSFVTWCSPGLSRPTVRAVCSQPRSPS